MAYRFVALLPAECDYCLSCLREGLCPEIAARTTRIFSQFFRCSAIPHNRGEHCSPTVELATRASERAFDAAAALSTSVFLTLIWAVTSRSYFWPVWPILVLALSVAAHSIVEFVLLEVSCDGRRRGAHGITAGFALVSPGG